MSRPVFIALLLVPQGLALLILAVSALTLKGFKSRHPKISTHAHLDAFKSMVKLHMYLALASMPILWAPALLFGLGVFMDQLAFLWDIFYVILPAGVVIGFAKLLKGLELSVREIPVSDDGLRQERDRVAAVWHGQALPDW